MPPPLPPSQYPRAWLTQQQPDVGVDGAAEGGALVEHKGGYEELAQAHEEHGAVLVRLAADDGVGLVAVKAAGAGGVRVKPHVPGLPRQHEQRRHLERRRGVGAGGTERPQA